MFSKTFQILLVIALKTLLVVSAQAEEEVQTSLPQTEVGQVLDGIASELQNISLEDFDLPKNGSDYRIDNNTTNNNTTNNNTTNNNTNIRRWAPYPQDLEEVSSERSLPSSSPPPWNSNPDEQPPTYKPQQVSSTTASPWISDFWNSLPIATGKNTIS